jgi:hypothetical protein
VELAIALLVLATPVLALVTAVLTFLTRKNVRKVHVLVDGRLTDVLNRVDQLTAALEKSDTDVPAPLPRVGNNG